MPAFIKNGPDIPGSLLRAHEEGKLVFFCGAGISKPAGLPDFKGLVDKLYDELNYLPDSPQQEAKKAAQYDKAIELLERDYIYGREKVRKKIAHILTPDLTFPKSTLMHEALLELSQNNKEEIRLVTTNFDRIFEEVIKNKRHKVNCFKAPLLPPNDRWHGIIYLHGLLPCPDNTTDENLDHLILSSGDYGLAYLVEGWAARFISELFRNYTVCFIGYSLSDPVLRYIVDAFAAQRQQGGSSKIFAFYNYPEGREEQIREQWEAKNITPILYQEYPKQKHYYLYETLREWTEIYNRGIYQKKKIIDKYAFSRPKSNFEAKLMLWAINDPVTAKYFSEKEPTPPFEWFAPFSKLFQRKNQDTSLNSVIHKLEHWLMGHINKPELVFWMTHQGNQFFDKINLLVQQKVHDLEQLEKESDQDESKKLELQNIRDNFPNAIPNPVMRSIWKMISSEKLEPNGRSALSFHEWCERFKKHGLTLNLRTELQRILTPRVSIERPGLNMHQPEKILDIFDCQIVLSSDISVRDILENYNNDKDFQKVWERVLPDLLQDFSTSLLEVFNLKEEIGSEDDVYDNPLGGRASALSGSFWGEPSKYMGLIWGPPSIEEHPLDEAYMDWMILISLTFKAWKAAVLIDQGRAKNFVENWWNTPHILFKRLALTAVINSDVIAPAQVVNWLLSDERKWLWSMETYKEVMRILETLIQKIDASLCKKIETAILEGPSPDETYNHETIIDHAILRRLEKMQEHGANLSNTSKQKLKELKNRYIGWTDPLMDKNIDLLFGPIEVTHEPANSHVMNMSSSTTESCITSKDIKTIEDLNRILIDLVRTQDNELLKEFWNQLAPMIETASDETINKILINVCQWIEIESKVFEEREDTFFSLIRRIMYLEYSNHKFSVLPYDLVFSSLEHPVGYMTRALLNWWYRQKPEIGAGLHDKVKSVFTEICNIKIEKFRYGRLFLAAHITDIFPVDETWTREHLLPFFSWRYSEDEARVVWQGFIQKKVLHPGILSVLKGNFLETAKYYPQLGREAQIFSQWLFVIFSKYRKIFTDQELREATLNISYEGREKSMVLLLSNLRKSHKQQGDYFRNCILPYLKKIWPQSKKAKTDKISMYMGMICVESGDAFPEAVEELHYWIKKDTVPRYTLHLPNKYKLCREFPIESLKFLDILLENPAPWLLDDLRQWLNYIERSAPKLIEDPRFIRLQNFCTLS